MDGGAQIAIIALMILAVFMFMAAMATALLCRFWVAHKKPISHWTTVVGAAVIPLLLAGVTTCIWPAIWVSHDGNGSPEGFIRLLLLLGALCAFPAFGVVARYKKRVEVGEKSVG